MIGTNPLAQQIAPYLANPQAFSLIARLDGSPLASSIFKTALHLANLIPIEQYSLHSQANLSNPAVHDSSSVPGMTYKPLSTLIPATIPQEFNNLTKFTPLSSDYLAVSSQRITPEIYYSIPGVVNNNYLYFRLLVSLFSTLIAENFLPMVPVDSSAAKIPFPGEQIF